MYELWAVVGCQPTRLLAGWLVSFLALPLHLMQVFMGRIVFSVWAVRTLAVRTPPDSCPNPPPPPQPFWELVSAVLWAQTHPMFPLSSDNYLIMPSGNLQIVNASQEDEGMYKCAAYNPVTQEVKTSGSSDRLRVRRKGLDLADGGARVWPMRDLGLLLSMLLLCVLQSGGRGRRRGPVKYTGLSQGGGPLPTGHLKCQPVTAHGPGLGSGMGEPARHISALTPAR